MATRESKGTGAQERGLSRRNVRVTPALQEPAPPPGPAFIVKRDRLVSALERRGREAGVIIICAPNGFGKTALLLQYTSAVAGDPERGGAALKSIQGRTMEQIMRELDSVSGRLNASMRPLIALDDLPRMKDEQVEAFCDRLRELRGRGFEVAVTCTPGRKEFMRQMGDAVKIGAQTLRVQPAEYHDWATTFSISSGLDAYRLTQGVPALMALLRRLGADDARAEALHDAIQALYSGILESLRSDRDALFRVACLLVLAGSGSIADFERCGMRVKTDMLARLARDYPIFGFEPEGRTFSCLGGSGPALAPVRRQIAESRRDLAVKAVRALAAAGEIDRAVRLAEELLTPAERIDVIDQRPTAFPMAGHAQFVRRAITAAGEERAAASGPGLRIALLLSALTMGDYRSARAACAELSRLGPRIERDVSPEDWDVVRAAMEVWGSCQGVSLPELSPSYVKRSLDGPAHLLRLYAQGRRALFEGRPCPPPMPEVPAGAPAPVVVNVPSILLFLNTLLDQALHQSSTGRGAGAAQLDALVEVLSARHLGAIAVRARMVAAIMRLMIAQPIADERAFVDANTVAIRENDLGTQALCLLAEGWEAISLGQIVNAGFRAQQVMKLQATGGLGDADGRFLLDWAVLLDAASVIGNSALVALRNDAELIDLGEAADGAAAAWRTALLLSAARFEADLSAWVSIHRKLLVERAFCPMARLAMHAIGDRANALRRLLPPELEGAYLLPGDEAEARAEPVFDVITGALGEREAARVEINLFGGFAASRNGHVLTSELWRRRRSGVLAARLALSLGAFVSRQALMEEMWPTCDYPHARSNLYSSLSALRRALRQESDGPQYVIVQGDGVALNPEFVSSDIVRFNRLARDVMLRHPGESSRQVMESCLKLEQIYAGSLYVPEGGDAAFFSRMRASFRGRFVDCMVCGIDAALEMDETTTASWLVEAALKAEPTREDVVRYAMRVYAACGRKREVVEIYNSHIYYLRDALLSTPEEETRDLYESIVGERATAAYL